jgi:hypothetical protein
MGGVERRGVPWSIRILSFRGGGEEVGSGVGGGGEMPLG